MRCWICKRPFEPESAVVKVRVPTGYLEFVHASHPGLEFRPEDITLGVLANNEFALRTKAAHMRLPTTTDRD